MAMSNKRTKIASSVASVALLVALLILVFVSHTTFQWPKNVNPGRLRRTLQDLPQLGIFGNNMEFIVGGLRECRGDCDADDDCLPGLICFHRDEGDSRPVPGCSGTDTSRTDYCIVPPATMVPSMDGPILNNMETSESPTTTMIMNSQTFQPTTMPSMQEQAGHFTGVGFLPQPPSSVINNQPVVEEGDEVDQDVGFGQTITAEDMEVDTGEVADETDLGFHQEQQELDNMNPTPSTGSAPSPSPTFDFRGPPYHDKTWAPTSEDWVPEMPPKPLQMIGNGNFSHNKLSLCQGECDFDSDCQGPLICKPRAPGDPIPDCIGTDDTRSDYCVYPDGYWSSSTVEPTSPWEHGFRLKLYWEEGYKWQNTTKEQRWCMTRDYTGWPGVGKCWYGDQVKPCNASHVYTAKCTDQADDSTVWEQQQFDFIPVRADEVLIQIYQNNLRCLERERFLVSLQPCDGDKPKQRWFAIRGGFNEERFELSQKSLEMHCLNQQHHPKPGEVFEMFPCNQTRLPSHETSWFTIY